MVQQSSFLTLSCWLPVKGWRRTSRGCRYFKSSNCQLRKWFTCKKIRSIFSVILGKFWLLCSWSLPFSSLNFLKLAEVFSRDGMSFSVTCQNLVTWPWIIDDLESFKMKWSKKSWKKASVVWLMKYTILWWILCLLLYFSGVVS